MLGKTYTKIITAELEVQSLQSRQTVFGMLAQDCSASMLNMKRWGKVQQWDHTGAPLKPLQSQG